MAIEVKNPIYGYGVVDSENPQIVNAINTMIDRGYSKESICKITGAPGEIVERHQRRRERGERPQTMDEREAYEKSNRK